MSEVPPGGNGTTIVMGRDGKFACCATAEVLVSGASAAKSGTAKVSADVM